MAPACVNGRRYDLPNSGPAPILPDLMRTATIGTAGNRAILPTPRTGYPALRIA